MSGSPHLRDLGAALRRERELLDQLRFRFLETRLLLTADEVRYLGWATAEVEQARLRAREADLLRAAAMHLVTDDFGGSGDSATLRDLAATADEPWAGILRDHHEGLCTVVSEIEMIGHRNAELARAAIRRLADESAPTMVDHFLAQQMSGGPAQAPPTLDLDAGPDLRDITDDVEESALQAVVTTASRLGMPALLTFLR